MYYRGRWWSIPGQDGPVRPAADLLRLPGPVPHPQDAPLPAQLLPGALHGGEPLLVAGRGHVTNLSQSQGLVDYVKRQVKCPECRAEHRVPYNGIQGFPTNVTLQRFIDLHADITGDTAFQNVPSQKIFYVFFSKIHCSSSKIYCIFFKDMLHLPQKYTASSFKIFCISLKNIYSVQASYRIPTQTRSCRGAACARRRHTSTRAGTVIRKCATPARKLIVIS